MAWRFRRFSETSKLFFFSRTISGDYYEKCRLWNLFRVVQYHGRDRIDTRILTRGFRSQRFLSSSKLPKKSTSNSLILTFIKSALDQPEGPNHCWFNNLEGPQNLVKKSGIFLVLSGQFSGSLLTNGFDDVILFEKVKLLQQRFPQLCVLGFQSDGLTCSVDERSSLIQLVLKENITFPFLLSNKAFYEVSNGPCFILFKDFKNPAFYQEKNLDFEVLNKAVEELHAQKNDNSGQSVKLFNTYTKQDEFVKEPNLCSLRNFLFHFPGCISADRGGDRVFVSDSNHHRIIVSDCDGKILDCIGSSPGFEDGEFGSAKLMRPAASFYHAADDYLYIVDTENHAIRRADLERRVLETLTPASNSNKKSGLLTWIMDKMGWKKSNDNTEPEENDVQTLNFPWHMMKSPGDSLLVIDRSFGTLWVIDLDSGEIEDVVKGFSNILEICGQQIKEKVSVLKQLPHDWLKQQAKAVCSPEELPLGGLISSFTNFQDGLITCDLVGQRIMKLIGGDEGASNLRFSNFGVLGFPYWFQPLLEKAYKEAVGPQGTPIDHVEHFSLLPGRVNLQINVNVPAGTQLVEPIQESCILRQARGLAIIVTELEDVTGSPEKVGSAQKWYDELDNLAFSTPESESANEGHKTSDSKFQDNRVQISTDVNTSPGTSEIIINAVLYLKLRREPDETENGQEKYATKIVDLMSFGTNGDIVGDSCVQFLLKSNRDLRDLIFMRPLHVRIKLDSLAHAKDEYSRDVVLTESSVEVNVSL